MRGLFDVNSIRPREVGDKGLDARAVKTWESGCGTFELLGRTCCGHALIDAAGGTGSIMGQRSFMALGGEWLWLSPKCLS